MIDKKVLVLTNDTKTFVGTLKSFDQKMNLMLTDCKQRIEDGDDVKEHEIGGYLIRGENIAMLGEVDAELDAQRE